MKNIKKILALLLVLLLTAACACAEGYEHDPRLDAATMKDIICDPEAIYAFSPNPESDRLGSYAEADWTDAELVENARQERIAYHESFEEMYTMLQEMTEAGNTAEEIARALSAKRNELRLAAYKDNPEGLAAAKESNLKTYGNEEGPTADSLFEKYGSWEMVTFKAFSSNPGMDACLGLYDEQYDHNVLTGAIVPSDKAVYVVKEGDYLIKIAKQFFGDPRQYKAIYEANKNVIGNVDVIVDGTELLIPVM